MYKHTKMATHVSNVSTAFLKPRHSDEISPFVQKSNGSAFVNFKIEILALRLFFVTCITPHYHFYKALSAF